MNTKITTLNQKIIFKLSAFKWSGHTKRFLRLKQIYDEKLPLMKIQLETPPPRKIEMFLPQLLIIREIYKIYLYTFVFEDDKKDQIF